MGEDIKKIKKLLNIISNLNENLVFFNNEIHFCDFFYFLLPISRESIVFGSHFRNGDFDGFSRFEVS